MKTFTYPGPALSTLVSFPITIKPNQNQPTTLDPGKVAIRVIVTPRKTGKPGPTHPVQVMKMLEDIADVKTVAAIRNTVNVCRPAEKINANVYVFRVICEALNPQQRMNITDPANQTFITKCTLWNKHDELDEIRYDKEVFLVDRELATEPQQMQEAVKQVTTNDTLTTMMQQSLEEALQKGREKSGIQERLAAKSSQLFQLESENREAEIQKRIEILLQERQERTRAAHQEEETINSKSNSKNTPAKTDPQKEAAAMPKQVTTQVTKGFLTIRLDPVMRNTMVTIDNIPATDKSRGPSVQDLAKYLITNL